MKRVLITKMAMIVGLLTGQLRAAETPSESEGERAPGDIGGRFLLGMQTQLARAAYGTENNSASSTERNWNTIGLSVGETPLGVVVGYGLHRDWLIEASLSAWRSSFETEAGSESQTNIMGEAALTYLFGQGKVRPYVGVQALAFTDSSEQSNYFGAGGGAHAGLRVELAEALSLEPRFAAGYAQTSTHIEVGSLQADIDERSVSGTFALRLAGWL